MRRSHVLSATVCLLSISLASCSGGSDSSSRSLPAAAERLSGDDFIFAKLTAGQATVVTQSQSSQAFSYPMPNLSAPALALHDEGDINFDRGFIQGPGSGHPDSEGLGPSFNNRSCNACHDTDGRGSLPILPINQLSVKFGANEAVLLKISIESADADRASGTSFSGGTDRARAKTVANGWGAPVGVPGFGQQLFHRGIFELRSDSPGTGQADVWMSYQTQRMVFPDGEVADLRIPRFEIANPYDAPGEIANPSPRSRLLQPDVRVSPRMGLPMMGLGLIEAISEEDILKLADPDDKNGDGIRGRPNYVFDVIKEQAGHLYPISLGRFGWKATAPSVAQQAMAAFNGDIGITNFLFPQESIYGTPLFNTAISDGVILAPAALPEASDRLAKSLIVYSQTLGVPARRNVDDPTVVTGGRIFAQINCTGCHTPSFTTGRHPDLPELSFQKIYLYSDGLLHDMGESLADGRGDFDAGGNDWKTRPLWGIGLTQIVNPRSGFLHDGRARTLQEAILFHGGEAAASRTAYMKLPRAKRLALIAFLQSL